MILFNVSPTANAIRSRGLGSKSHRKELRASVVEPPTLIYKLTNLIQAITTQRI